MRIVGLVFLCILSGRGSAQTPVKSEQRELNNDGIHILSLLGDAKVQFLVTAIDESTNAPIPSFSLQMDPQGNESGGSVSGSGVLRASLTGGRYAMLVSAKGYLTEVLEGIDIPGKSAGGGYSTYPINDHDTFVGTTIGLRISLRKLDPNINRKTRRRPFLSDTTFYEITSPAPEFVGGSGPLMGRIRRGASSIVSGTDTVVLAKSWFTAYIDKTGRVVRVEAENRGRRDVDQLIMNALYQTKFSPGQILGKPVSSKIMIPFELILRSQNKKRRGD